MGVVFSAIFTHEFALFQALYTHTHLAPSFGDYLLNLVAGIPIHHLTSTKPYQFPGLWLLFFLLLGYTTLFYPAQSLKKAGTFLLVETQNRWVWWFSKCIWIALSTLVYFAVAAASALFWTLVSEGRLTDVISGITPQVLFFGEFAHTPTTWQVGVWFYLALVGMSIVLCLAQMILSFIIKPIGSFLCFLGFLLLSSYITSEALVANFTMAARSSYFFPDGMNAQQGVILALVLLVALVWGGGYYFKQRDIY